MKNILVAACAATLMAGSAIAADIDATLKVELGENATTNKYTAKTTVQLDVAHDEGLAFGSISLKSVDNASVGVDKWHFGTTVAGARVSFGDQGGIMPEAVAGTSADTLVDTNAAMEESLQVSVAGLDFALGMTDIRTDVSEIANVQAAYTIGLPIAAITGAVDYNRTTEEYTYAASMNGLDVGPVALGSTVTYALSNWAYEVDTTLLGGTGPTLYLNGDESDAMQHVGVQYTQGLNGLDLTTELDYDTDNKNLSPTVTLSFAF